MLFRSTIDWILSEHAWVFNKQKHSVPLLNNWKRIIKDKLWDSFYQEYKNELRQYDAFITCYPPAFSLLYKNFDKPVIMCIPIRYEHPFSSDPYEWEFFNNYIKDGVDSGKIILVSNSAYDKKYCENFIDRNVTYIPSLCGYLDELSNKYQANKNGYIYFSRDPIQKINAIPWKNGNRHHFNDLLRFSGIIHFPYQVSTMSIFEHYYSNIPLFFPEKEYLLNLYQNGSNVLKEISWNIIFGLPSRSTIKTGSNHDPNDFNNIESMQSWINYADFYSESFMPFITYFKSIEHLNEIINLSIQDLALISDQMRKKNIEREEYVNKSWEEVISRIKPS